MLGGSKGRADNVVKGGAAPCTLTATVREELSPVALPLGNREHVQQQPCANNWSGSYWKPVRLARPQHPFCSSAGDQKTMHSLLLLLARPDTTLPQPIHATPPRLA